MKLLLDTHAFLWFFAGDAALSTRARRAIEDKRHDRCLSAASIWEIAVKHSLGKLELEVELAELVEGGTAESGITVLDVGARHALGVASLPFHHRDPFDRILISQAIVESLTIVSRDVVFDAYGVRRVW